MLTAFADSEYGRLREVLLCAPHRLFSANGNQDMPFSNIPLAVRQYETLLKTIQYAGIKCHFIPSNPDTSYQCYTRDSFVVTPWGLLISNMGFEARSLEPEAVTTFALKSKIKIWKSISQGSLEGGDVQILRPGYAAVGTNGDRTTMDAALEVKQLFEQEGWNCRIIKYPPKYRHLDILMGVLDSFNIICCEQAISRPDLKWLELVGFQLHFVPEKEARNMACNIVSLGDGRILSYSQNLVGNALMEKKGFKVVGIDISQFVSDKGGIHCLVNALRRDTAVPPKAMPSHYPTEIASRNSQPTYIKT